MLGHRLRALAERLQRLALVADRLAGLALAELAGGAAHRLARLAELAVGLHAHALHLIHQLLERLFEALLLLPASWRSASAISSGVIGSPSSPMPRWAR